MRFSFAAAVVILLALPAAAQQPAQPAAPQPAQPNDALDKELMRLESTKWDPMSLLHPIDLMALFSDEMLSVDYGTDLQGGAERRTWREVLGFGAVPSWTMKLSEWKVLHPTPDVAIVSYKVTGVSVQWKGYATSTWARRNGKWETVFYQASTAK